MSFQHIVKNVASASQISDPLVVVPNAAADGVPDDETLVPVTFHLPTCIIAIAMNFTNVVQNTASCHQLD